MRKRAAQAIVRVLKREAVSTYYIAALPAQAAAWDYTPPAFAEPLRRESCERRVFEYQGFFHFGMNSNCHGEQEVEK